MELRWRLCRSSLFYGVGDNDVFGIKIDLRLGKFLVKVSSQNVLFSNQKYILNNFS